jgi:hypothetical protein
MEVPINLTDLIPLTCDQHNTQVGHGHGTDLRGLRLRAHSLHGHGPGVGVEG